MFWGVFLEIVGVGLIVKFCLVKGVLEIFWVFLIGWFVVGENVLVVWEWDLVIGCVFVGLLLLVFVIRLFWVVDVRVDDVLLVGVLFVMFVGLFFICCLIVILDGLFMIELVVIFVILFKKNRVFKSIDMVFNLYFWIEKCCFVFIKIFFFCNIIIIKIIKI